MFPYLYEFRWDADHIVFISVFSTVVLVVAGTLLLAAARTLRRLRAGGTEPHGGDRRG